MKKSRLWLAALVAVIIVAIGLYWNQRPTTQNQGSSDRANQSAKQESLDLQDQDWDVAPEARVTLEADADAGDTYERFQVPGRIVFPGGESAGPIDLQLTIRPVKPERAAELAGSSSDEMMRNLFQGGPDQAFHQETIRRSIRTDTNGNFSIEKALPGIYELSLSDTNWSIANKEPKIQLAERVQPLRYEVSQTARLNGRVVDAEGNSLEATVSFTDGSDSVTTDDEGNFTLGPLEAGRAIDNLAIHRDGYLTDFPELEAPEPGETVEETFTLERSGQLRVLVRNENGEPVTEGQVVLERADDKTIQYGTQQSVPHGEGKITAVNDEGAAVFNALQPGEVTFGLTFSEHIAEKMNATIEAGESREVTYTVREGTPVTLNFLNESNGEPAKDIEPAIKTFDEEGNELDPAFELKDQTGPGEYEGVVHPATERITMNVTSPLRSFESKEVSFDRSELPELTVQLVPTERSGPPGKPTPPGLVELEVTSAGSPIDWSTVDNARLYVMDESNGERVLGRTGGESVFTEPLPLENGTYRIYAAILREGSEDLSVSETIEVSSQHPGQRSLEASPSGSVTGRIERPEGSPRGLRVGISLFETELRDNETIQSVYYPPELTTTVDSEGRYTIDHVPSGVASTLHVLATGEADLQVSSGTVVAATDVPTLSTEESRTLSTITIQPE